MSPSALLEDRVPSCMLYSMVECRAWGSRTHPWPCRAMPGNSVQSRCAPRREGKVKGLGGGGGALPHGRWGRVLDCVLTHVLIALTMSAARSWGRHHALKKWRQHGGGQFGGGTIPDCVLLHVLIRRTLSAVPSRGRHGVLK